MKWFLLSIVFVMGCSSSTSLPVAERMDSVATNEERKVEVGVSTAADVEVIFGKPGRDVSGAKVGSTAGLRMMSYDEPARSVFLKDGKVVLVVEVAKSGGVYPTTISDWNNRNGKPNRILPSTQGKNFRIYVYGQQGLAVTFDEGGKVLTVESFVPMSADEYERTFHTVPTKFVK